MNAFLSNLPQVLDYNFGVGEGILLNCILILQKLPFPPRHATSWQHAHTLMQESMIFQVKKIKILVVVIKEIKLVLVFRVADSACGTWSLH